MLLLPSFFPLVGIFEYKKPKEYNESTNCARKIHLHTDKTVAQPLESCTQRPAPVCQYTLLWFPVQFLFSFVYGSGTTQLQPRLKKLIDLWNSRFRTSRTFVISSALTQ